MASSNRHWPSLFKSKPCSTTNPWQADLNSSSLLSSACPRPPYTSAIPSGEERAPEPKPRWNPKPEQIRILETIFNSGMVNPPREEIRKIRMQLQEYGQVGDANIFYWFQNRKSRSKHKQRLQQSSRNPNRPHASPSALISSSSSSSSSSDPSTPSMAVASGAKKMAEPSNSPTASVNQAHSFHKAQGGEPTFFQAPQDLCSLIGSSDLEFGLICNGTDMDYEFELHEEGKEKHMLHSTVTTTATAGASVAAPTSTNHGLTGSDFQVGTSSRSMLVFINEVAFEVGMGPVNIREAFGQDSILFSSWGLPVPVDEWGVTLQPLQHGASYYLVV